MKLIISARLILLIIFVILLESALTCYGSSLNAPNTQSKASPLDGSGDGDLGGSGTATPDLFTGTMSYSIPLEVVPGRKGMQPKLALTYRSNSGNGWVGVGWDLEVGAIERSTKKGVDLNGDDFVLRMNGAVIDLVRVDGVFHAKIESGFNRIQQISAGGLYYWEVTDKTGTKYLYGQSNASRQTDLIHQEQVFKWCLDHVEDTNGNFMDLVYTKNPPGGEPDQGQVYLTQIKYTGNSQTQASPTNVVNFYSEPRPDVYIMYSTRFHVRTTHRLKTIEVKANGNMVRAYTLLYNADPTASIEQISPSTNRSLLYSVQQYDSNASVAGDGSISGGTALPPVTFLWQSQISSGAAWTTSTHYDSSAAGGLNIFKDNTNQYDFPGAQFDLNNTGTIQFADVNGDGRADACIRLDCGVKCWLSKADGTGWEESSGFNSCATDQHIFSDTTVHGATSNDYWPSVQFVDVNGDGMADVCAGLAAGVQCWLSTGTGWSNSPGYDSTNINNPSNAQHIFADGTSPHGTFDGNNRPTLQFADVNGDGKADVCARNDTGIQCFLSKADGTGWEYSDGFDSSSQFTGMAQNIFKDYADQHETPNNISDYFTYAFDGDNWPTIRFVDVNGDGKADACVRMDYGMHCYLSTGTTWVYSTSYDSYFTGQHIFSDETFLITNTNIYPFPTSVSVSDSWKSISFVDINGDGLVDVCARLKDGLQCWLSTGTGWAYSGPYNSIFTGQRIFAYDTDEKGYLALNNDNWPTMQFVDVNGDGKADACIRHDYGLQCWLSTGNGWAYSAAHDTYATGQNIFSDSTNDGNWSTIKYADVDGDGRIDTCIRMSNGLKCWQNQVKRDLLAIVNNGIGGTTSIAYTPSTSYNNIQLPFAVETVSSILADDGNGVTSKTTYSYESGYYNYGDRDFRGFNYVKVTGPIGPNNEQQVTETWFHQGNETNVLPESTSKEGLRTLLSVATGYMKGRAYRTRVSDGRNNRYAVTETKYQPFNSSQYYFIPPVHVDTFSCEAGASTCNGGTGKYIYSDYDYDSYGNLKQEIFHGGDTDNITDRTITRIYSSNTTAWIMGLPIQEVVLNATGMVVSKTTYFYDNANSCTDTSTNQVPVKGNLTRIVRWLDGTNDPAVRMAYDSYGNLACTRDANEKNPSLFTYDETNTLQKSLMNPLGYRTITQYYGVDSQPAVNGLYGQVMSITDPNSRITSMQYDSFGRKIHIDQPDGSWTSWTYPMIIDSGKVGIQNYAVTTSDGLNSWTYFDGLGRTIIQKKTGPDSKMIVTKTQYNSTGTVKQTSLPYFDETETPRYTTFTYDSLGRNILINNPDQSRVMVCFGNGIVVSIDANGHRKRETKDALGRLVRVEEYNDINLSCTIDGGTLYATTYYSYDILGNLRTIQDAIGSRTTITYDSLGRKISMQDADMGAWTYAYYTNGNLKTQTDAKGQTITFFYDDMNRPIYKDFPEVGTHVVTYAYDEGWSSNAIGRLTTMIDESGITKYYYNPVGRIKVVEKVISDQTYTTKYRYDGLGRITRITYPDDDFVQYIYDANVLSRVSNSNSVDYARYSNYNAFGRVRHIDFMNGVATDYTYSDTNNRLQSIITSRPSTTNLVDISFTYDNVGNIASVTDSSDRPVQPNVADDVTSYSYDINKPHAVQQELITGTTYSYDANGNMVSDGTRTIMYNVDNMPTSITYYGKTTQTTNFVYDGAGSRVVKTTPQGPVIYIGKLYECNANTCTKNIFAGNTRLANKTVGMEDTIFYHYDQLGSTAAVSGVTGTKIEDIQYYPFGEEKSDTGDLSVNHKYTSQEFDGETGLYYYNARYYNPDLGRFISADTIVPDPRNPQTLNRYSYVINNPLIYTDPNGHDIWSDITPHFHIDFDLGLHNLRDNEMFGSLQSAAVAFVLSGFNPVVASAAFVSTYTLQNTGEGKAAVNQLAGNFIRHGIFHDQDAHTFAYAFLNSAMNYAILSTYNHAQGKPTVTIRKDLPITKGEWNSELFNTLRDNQGKGGWMTGGGNVSDVLNDGGSAYAITDSSGNVVGVYAQGGAFSSKAFGDFIGLQHTTMVIQNASGQFFNSLSGFAGGNIYLALGVCHNMTSQAFFQAGYANIVAGIPMSSWSTYLTSLTYGPYGSDALVQGSQRAR